MPGFINDNRITNRISRTLSNLSSFNQRYENLLIKNSQAIGYIEGQLLSKTNANVSDVMKAALALSDTTSAFRTKSIAFFQLEYPLKRERLREIASNGEIEFILETIADDLIVYDENNRFCYNNDITGKVMYKGETKGERLSYMKNISDYYSDAFNKIYNAWGFNEGISAWQYAYQFLIEGHLAFEIIYDDIDAPTEIIGFKELDPATLSPSVSTDASGKMVLEWEQHNISTGETRHLTDSQVIYISYSNHMRTNRVSFVERLIRSFNLLRVIENSKVIWHVMNAPIRLTTTVPIGSKSLQKAMEDISEFTNTLKEDVYYNGDTGELKVEGKPNVMYYKNYIVPVNDNNEQIKIEPLQYPGPNLSGSELLNHFMKKLKMDSKIPFSRWEGQSGMGAFTLNAEGISKEEIRYNKFIKRLRSALQELITKPLYLQMCLKYEALKTDSTFKNSIGLVWNNDNLFEEMKRKELDAKRIASFTAKKGIVNDDGTPYFSTDYLVKTELMLTDDEINMNKAYKEAEAKKEHDESAEAGATVSDIGGGSASGAEASVENTEAGSEVIEGGETSGEGSL